MSPVNDSVFVSDRSNSQIHVFNVEKRHVRTFGQCGEGEGKLDGPIGISVSANGQLYVANQWNNCVSVFGEEGTFIRTIGQGTLSCPWDVFVHSSGLVYVADSSNPTLLFSHKRERWYIPLGHGEEGRESLVFLLV